MQGKVLKWALTWGRRIVVLTELVVIAAFLSRFWLDTRLADMGEKIAQKRAVVTSSADFEKKFRQVLLRLEKLAAIEKQTPLLAVYDQTKALIPSEVVVSQMSAEKSTVSFTGKGREEKLAELIAAFRHSSGFTDIVLERIAKESPAAEINFAFKSVYGR